MARKHIFTCLLLLIVALLAAAWVTNFFGQFGGGTRSGEFDHHYSFRSGSLCISQDDNSMVQGLFWRAHLAIDPQVDPAFAALEGDQGSLSARLRVAPFASGPWSAEL